MKRLQAEQASVSDMVLVFFGPEFSLDLKRSPSNITLACEAVFGSRKGAEGCLIPLQQVLGIIGSFEQRRKGFPIEELEGRTIHLHYGVFPPTRREHYSLVAKTPLPQSCQLAIEIGVGSGVLSAILLHHKKVHKVIATDISPRAIACARENFERLGFGSSVDLHLCSLFPDIPLRPANLIVCNPPWIPYDPKVASDQAVYDKKSSMLQQFLKDARSRLAQDGQIWLIVSNLAELIGLRDSDELHTWFTQNRLAVETKYSASPIHKKIKDADDPLHECRAKEVTTLFVLKHFMG
jgi:methylase of polypeptide subunit release factors